MIILNWDLMLMKKIFFFTVLAFCTNATVMSMDYDREDDLSMYEIQAQEYLDSIQRKGVSLDSQDLHMFLKGRISDVEKFERGDISFVDLDKEWESLDDALAIPKLFDEMRKEHVRSLVCRQLQCRNKGYHGPFEVKKTEEVSADEFIRRLNSIPDQERARIFLQSSKDFAQKILDLLSDYILVYYANNLVIIILYERFL